MPTSASTDNRAARKTVLLGAVAVAVCTAIAGPAFAQASGKIPELASSKFAWFPQTADGRIAFYGTGWFDPPAGLRGPIKPHPDYPLRGNDMPGTQPTLAIGNYLDPVLKPWAAEQMRLSNEEIISGKRGMPFLAQSRCYPGGVPGQLLYTAEPFYFIQQSKQVWMIWQRDQMVRRIAMTDKHSADVKPSWFGESVGRYENDELVVDTIGLSTHMSYIDMFRTPHTEKLHVLERFKITADGRFLEAFVKITDEDTFNEPIYGTKRWRKQDNEWRESICRENNADHFNHNLFPIPEAKTSDF